MANPPSMPPATRTATKGRWFEDFEPGMEIHHKWGRTLTQAEAAAFATQTMNHNPLWFNAEYARAAGHPDIVVCPWLVLNVVLGMTVEDISEKATALLGYGEMEFVADVHPGDTLTASSVVLETRPSSSKPDQGVLRVQTVARDQHGRIVLRYERTNLIRRRPGAHP